MKWIAAVVVVVVKAEVTKLNCKLLWQPEVFYTHTDTNTNGVLHRAQFLNYYGKSSYDFFDNIEFNLVFYFKRVLQSKQF